MIPKALVVDDDAIILDLLENILERNGYDITRATDADQAVRVLEANDFDLVITDLIMGKTSGFDVIRKTKTINSKTIAIMITGCCDSSCEIEAFHHGADHYLLKPFSPKDLLDTVQFQILSKFNTLPSILQGV
jgi:DNA-binding response OmpR family regulator